MLVAVARAGAATAALRVIERFPLPADDPSAEAVENARSSVLTLWELISGEQPSSAGGALETYGADSKANIRSAMEETFYEVTALCPSLTGRAVTSLISMLNYFAANSSGGGKVMIAAGEETQPADVRVAAAALGLVRFWCADDFNRRYPPNLQDLVFQEVSSFAQSAFYGIVP